LYLKTIILGHGSRCLPDKPVIERFYGPRSLRALIAMVCQIFESVGWDRFKTEVIPDLGDLRAGIGKLETINTTARTLQPNTDLQVLATLLPEFAKDMAVNVFARGRRPSANILGKMMKKTDSLNAQFAYGKPTEYLKLERPALLGATRESGARIDSEYNVQTHPYLTEAAIECKKANRQFELNMKAIVIGHTHFARIAVQRDDGGGLTFALIDTGAWIEQCRETEEGPTMDNAQITAISANEIRIYQLEPM